MKLSAPHLGTWFCILALLCPTQQRLGDLSKREYFTEQAIPATPLWVSHPPTEWPSAVRVTMIQSLKTLIAHEQSEIQKLTPALGVPMDSRTENFVLPKHWKNLARASFQLAQLGQTDEAMSLTIEILPTSFLEAQRIALLALRQLSHDRAAAVGISLLNRYTDQKDIAETGEMVMQSALHQEKLLAQLPEGDLVRSLIAQPGSPLERAFLVSEADEFQMFRRMHFDQLFATIRRILIDLHHPEAHGLIRHLLKSRDPYEIEKGAREAAKLGDPKLLHALDLSLEYLSIWFLTENPLEVAEPQAWNSNKKWLHLRTVQIQIIRAKGLLGDRTSAMTQLHQWLDFHLQVKRSAPAEESRHNRQNIVGLFTALFELGDLEGVRARLQVYLVDFDKSPMDEKTFFHLLHIFQLMNQAGITPDPSLFQKHFTFALMGQKTGDFHYLDALSMHGVDWKTHLSPFEEKWKTTLPFLSDYHIPTAVTLIQIGSGPTFLSLLNLIETPVTFDTPSNTIDGILNAIETLLTVSTPAPNNLQKKST